ncbi:hypothetical protein [Nocardia wallacei]|uniref:hypothetical protein n=1 Tax=Nocardia wallacei TaxID=480035 RepID=UPI00245541DB|nr:hypothetical protein [Nocardia wallacei]
MGPQPRGRTRPGVRPPPPPPRPRGHPPRGAAPRAEGCLVTHGELNLGAHAIAAPLPGWGRPTAINIVTNRQAVIDAARRPLLDAVREIGAHAANPEA